MLYSKAPSGAVMVSVPVGVAHVGCTVAVAVGTAGAPAAATIVITAPLVTHVASLLARTEIG